jgi:hypothetical protein
LSFNKPEFFQQYIARSRKMRRVIRRKGGRVESFATDFLFARARRLIQTANQFNKSHGQTCRPHQKPERFIA